MRQAARGGWAVGLAIAAAACGASFDGTVYRHEDLAFRVGPIPASWRPITISDAALAFRDDARDATIAVSGRCGKDAEDIPLDALTQHLFLLFTDREIRSQTVVPFDGREAMHSVLSAKLDGVPKAFDIWVLKKDGCVYDLLFIAAPSSFDAGAGEFRAFVSGFSTIDAVQ